MPAAKNSFGTAEPTAGLLDRETTVVAPLVLDNIAPATRLLGELQRQLEQALGEPGLSNVGIEKVLSGIMKLETDANNARKGYKLRAMDELNTVVSEQSELAESLPSLEERISRTVIRAPMDGIVSLLNFQTPGGFVNMGDVMLELVPTGEALIIEAKIMPKNISHIRVEDEVRIHLSAYDSSKYGSVEGRVLWISADAVVDKNNEGISHYLVDVGIGGELTLEGKNGPVTFIPGMTATVDVLSGKRTVLEYIWQPMSKVQELALRD